MDYTDDDIKRLAMLREWLEKQITDKEEELERLRSMLAVVDNMLKQVSFKPALTLPREDIGLTEAIKVKEDITKGIGIVGEADYKEVKTLKTKDNITLANAYISSNAVSIVPTSDMRLYASTPPFQSFFVNRILKEMRIKDEERARNKEITVDQILDYKIEQDENGMIKRVVVYNYRDKDRLNEILNTATWVFTRMLEKVK